MPNKLPTRREAVELIISRWSPTRRTETVAVTDALSRVSARDEYAKFNIPVVRASSMDGIGVDSKRFALGVPDTSDWLLGRDYVRADTGDDFDDRFDAVIRIEDVTLGDIGVKIADGLHVTAGLNVRPAGSTVRRGDVLVRAGTRLRPHHLGALHLGGVTELDVLMKPVVAFVPTGSELVPVGTEPRRGEIVDSNSVMVCNMLTEMGAEPLLFPIVRDEPDALREALLTAAKLADIILVNGGSSKGGEDFNAEIIAELGEPILHWVAAAPGRPMAAAILNGKPLINIPGPPLAAYFVTDWCATALVAHYYGITPPIRATVTATLGGDYDATPGMEILRKMNLEKTDDGWIAIPLHAHGGSAIETLTAPGKTATDGGTETLAAGGVIEVEIV
ncbi:MAG: molybdopterin molybdotransferase MoeA [Oscillospiraceae bacterium]|jgi:molybdopterin molybdotransferase/putative molybdopterin biosynthesis protein|nr:molybdopterin molybdotransferase MoeA [Oscillospiraceae bacterium]